MGTGTRIFWTADICTYCVLMELLQLSKLYLMTGLAEPFDRQDGRAASQPGQPPPRFIARSGIFTVMTLPPPTPPLSRFNFKNFETVFKKKYENGTKREKWERLKKRSKSEEERYEIQENERKRVTWSKMCMQLQIFWRRSSYLGWEVFEVLYLSETFTSYLGVWKYFKFNESLCTPAPRTWKGSWTSPTTQSPRTSRSSPNSRASSRTSSTKSTGKII